MKKKKKSPRIPLIEQTPPHIFNYRSPHTNTLRQQPQAIEGITSMRGSRNRDGGIARNEGDGEPRSRSTSFDQHFRSHVASPGSTPSRGGRRRLEGRSVPRAGAEEPAVTSDGSTIFALSECKLLGSRTEIILIFVFVGEELEQPKNRTGRSVALQQ